MAAVLVYNACCISKLRTFLFYRHPWVALRPGLTVYTSTSMDHDLMKKVVYFEKN